MKPMNKLRTLIRNLFLRKHVESDLDAEVRGYSAMLEEEKMSKGMKSNEARRAARMESGGAELLKEEVRSARAGAWIESLGRDIRYAARMLRKNPGFTAIAVLTLALGIGANSAIFSIVNAVLLRPLPYPDSGRLVVVWATEASNNNSQDVTSYPGFEDWKAQSRSFEGLAAFTSRGITYSGADQAEVLSAMQISPGFLELLGVAPAMGRTFQSGESEAGASHVALLSDSLWKARFAGRPDILGQLVRINEQECTIVGVMPPGVRISRGPAEQIYVPLVRDPDRGHGFLTILGRLRQGTSISQSQAEMNIITKRLEVQYPRTDKGVGANVVPLVNYYAGDARTACLFFLGVVTLVLLIACTNVANLLLSRGASRQKELAVRAALGAGRRRIIQQLLTESILLALAGGTLGIFLASWMAHLLATMLASNFDIPRVASTGTDVSVLGFTLLVSLATGVLFGIAPALSSSSPDWNENLREAGRSAAGSVRGRRLRGFLVIAETSLALILLSGAGILLKSLLVMRATAPGFTTQNLLAVDFRLPRNKMAKPLDLMRYYDDLLQRAESVPGVRSASLVADLPMNGGQDSLGFHIPGRPDPAPGKMFSASFNIVSANYLQTMEIPLIAGREFGPQDSASTPHVVLINERAAKTFWPGENPIGKQITLPSEEKGGPSITLTVVGETRDVRQISLGVPPRPEVLLNYQQPGPPWPWLELVARTTVDPATLSNSIKSAAFLAGHDVPIVKVHSMDDVLSASLAVPIVYTSLLSVFAGLALALAAVGLYGVVSYSAAQRTHEMGIRLALGADRGNILRLVLRHGLGLVLIGVAIGMAGAVAIASLLTHLAPEIQPGDPITFTAVAVLLIVVALAASFLPALRASRVDPMIALRYE
jgi:putative ABC transport system permease protein